MRSEGRQEKISRRKLKEELLLHEIEYFGLYEIAKVISAELPTRMWQRIINKLRRLRNISEINSRY